MGIKIPHKTLLRLFCAVFHYLNFGTKKDTPDVSYQTVFTKGRFNKGI